MAAPDVRSLLRRDALAARWHTPIAQRSIGRIHFILTTLNETEHRGVMADVMAIAHSPALSGT